MNETRDPGTVLACARLEIRKKSPYLLSAVYALTPVEVPETLTSFVTPGMVMGFNPNFIAKCSDEEAGFVMLHEALHIRLNFFEQLVIIGKDDLDIVNEAQDMVINVMLRDMGWPVFKWASMPAKYNFPEGLSTPEYVELLRQRKNKQAKSGKDEEKTSGVCGGSCRAPSKEMQDKLDGTNGRSQTEVKAIEKKVAQDIQKHVEAQQGRGKLPGWMQEWAKLAEEEQSKINWRYIINSVLRDTTGRIISGGDDYSLRRPSKRSFVRRLVRPGLIDQEVVPIFILDTSGSMNTKMLLMGIRETCGLLRQLGIEEAYYMEVDAAVALEPKRIDLSYFSGDIQFHGRCGTDFRPAFKAIEEMHNKPDLAIYWTDGDGVAPTNPPPNLEVIWGLIPGGYAKCKPARWGHLVVIDEDPDKQQLFEDAPVYEDEDEDLDYETG